MGGNGCDRWTSQNTDPTAADDHGDRLIDMAVHGCLSNMGGQVCRRGAASVRYSVFLVPAQFIMV